MADALHTAVAALVSDEAQLATPPPRRALIHVADPLAGYHELARWERRRRSWSVVAITGSVGKTTTKDFVASLLAGQLDVGASSGNRNSTLGLPAELLSQPEDAELFVAEAGMTHAGELDLLGGILAPDVLVYTRIAAVHTAQFADISGVVDAKAELLPYLSPSGCLVVNGDDPHQTLFAARVKARVVRYGTGCDVELEVIEDRGLLGSRLALVVSGQRVEVGLALAGLHQAENLLAAVTAAWVLGLRLDTLPEAVGQLEAAARRGRIHAVAGDVTVIDDSYNSSPVAVERLLALLARSPGRRVAVLGEMYELGEDSADAHRQAGRRAAAASDLVVAVGAEDARELADAAYAAGLAPSNVHHTANAEEAAERVRMLLEPGDVILVKGSRGVGLDRVVDELVGGGGS